jgi:nicotinate phosphoribosyltransferase
MDASFRRAAGYKISVKTAEIALKNGFKATSNVGAYFDSSTVTDMYIGGTMAHAFIMSFETELEAFKVWYEIFPGTAILVDTYDTINAINILIENNLKPDCVRIDSGDFFIICKEVRTILDKAGWTEVGIYISGDLTPEILNELHKKNVPFNKAMIGTKLANIGEIVKINPGFVYKVVEYITKEGKRIFPEKKAEGKGNYPGLKVITVENEEVILNTTTGKIGFNDLDLINEEMPVKYLRG